MDLPVSLPDSLERHFHATEDLIECLEKCTRVMKVYRNTLVPISCLPTEILSVICSLLTSQASLEAVNFESSLPTPSFSISHVCHRWREISLNLPYLWSFVNLTKLTPAGAAVMLARAKMAPLHLEVETIKWNKAKFKAFKEQINAHMHHIRHLGMTVKPNHLKMFGQLVSSAPSLQLLSICNQEPLFVILPVIIPDTLFNGVAPNLTYLVLYNCGIRWQSPLLKGLRDLELFSFPARARTTLHSWLRALKRMPQLESLVLRRGVPCDLVVLSEGLKLTVDLPSLTELSILGSVSECAVVLAHLVLPALTRLCIIAKNDLSAYGSVNDLIQCVAQNAHGSQDTEALQSLFIQNNKTQTDFVAWTMPRQDSDDALRGPIDLPNRTRRTRLEFSIQRQYEQPYRMPMNIQQYNALLAALPLNSLTRLTVKGRTPLSKDDWRSHALRWHKLERVRLGYDVVPAFQRMFEDAAVLGDPLLPSLEELILSDISLNAQKVYYLCDMLIKCVELGIPLRTLDLRTCTAAQSRSPTSQRDCGRRPWSCEEAIGSCQLENTGKRRRSWQGGRKR